MTAGPAADTERLGERLSDRWDDSVRSVVEYSPQTGTIHYLREDIDRTLAEHRLVRIEELYQAERLSANPKTDEEGLGLLCASVHFFAAAIVVHVIEPAGVVYGVSFDHSIGASLFDAVQDCIVGLYGEIPDRFEGTALGDVDAGGS